MTPNIAGKAGLDAQQNEQDRTGAAASDGLQDALAQLGVNAGLAKIAAALEAGEKRESQRRQRRNTRQIEYLKELYEVFKKIVDAIDPTSEAATKAYHRANDLGSSRHHTLRKAVGTQDILVCRTNDHFFTQCRAEVGTATGFYAALNRFKSRQVHVNQLFDEAVGVPDRDEMVEAITTELEGFSLVLRDVQRHIEKFPTFCSELTTLVRVQHNRLKEIYGKDPSNETEPDALTPLFELFGISTSDLMRRKEPVPVFMSNVHLTSLLNEIVRRIPEQPVSKDASATLEPIDPAEITNFRELLIAIGEHKLMEMVTTQQGYYRMAHVIESLHSVYKTIYDAIQNSDFEEVLQKNPLRQEHTYEHLMQRARRIDFTKDGENDFTRFESTESVAYLRNFKPYALGTAVITEAGPKQAGPGDREKSYLAIFQKLMELLDDLAAWEKAKESIDPGKLNTGIQELIELKTKLKRPTERLRAHELAKDQKEGNFVYEVGQREHGHIVLRRRPSYPVRYEYVIGKTWQDILRMLSPVFEYGELDYLLSHGTAREKNTNSFLIASPYGLGKDYFAKALVSDPRIVGIHATTRDLLTYWQHQTEKSPHELWGLAQQEAEKRGKISAIVWDEFHDLYPGRKRSDSNDGGSLERARTALQTVLDGMYSYPNTAFVALSNHLNRIPPVMYRRFEKVIIVAPYTAEERVALMKSLLRALPLADTFEEGADWQGFIDQSQSVDGESLGRIYDEMYKFFLYRYRTERPEGKEAAQLVRGDLREIVNSDRPLTREDRAIIFRTRQPEIVVAADDFNSIMRQILQEPVTRKLMRRQEKWYELAEKHMEESFDND